MEIITGLRGVLLFRQILSKNENRFRREALMKPGL
jgi:hypothetical protein